MTKFVKENFFYYGGYLTYRDQPGEVHKVVARFKYRGPINKSTFLKELIRNHTVESYFAKMENPDSSKRMAPIEILRNANPDWYEGCVEKYRAKLQ